MVFRREFLNWLGVVFFFIFSGCISKEGISMKKQGETGEELPRYSGSKVYVIKTQDRRIAINELLKYFDIKKLSGKKVALKANFNSSDPFPASTHPDTLSGIVDIMKGNGASVTLAERSGMGDTRRVLEDTGVMALAGKLGFETVILDDLKTEGWLKENPGDSHWSRGFLFPKVFREADAVVQTCCLKTHRFGGHFTMSLKNSVGMVAKYDPEDGYNYMSELHSSRYQREMIAEINTAYKPELVLMDGIKGFSKGGPDTGTLIEPGIVLASTDRVAIDAVGVAVLRIYGTTNEVSRGKIFQQEQIARAAKLGLGASSPDEIEVVAVNNEAQDICSQITGKLKEP